MEARLTFVRRSLMFLVSGFCLGILFAPLPIWGENFNQFLLVLALILFLLFLVRGRNFNLYLWLALSLVGVSLGLWRFQTFGVININLDKQIGEKVTVEGQIVEMPDERDTSTRLVVAIKDTKTKLLVSTSPYKKLTYGDVVKVSGQLARPENFSTASGREFNYISYLKVRGIRHEISFAWVEITASGQGNIFLTWLFKVKDNFTDRLNLVLPEPHSSLMAGLLLGERRGLGENLTESFRRAGVIHLVVLSGYNMTIVAEALIIFFGTFLSFSFSLVAGVVGIIIFAVMVGGGATVIRASIMAILAIFARYTGRIYSASLALGLAGAIMIAVNPYVLAYDIGFQLSFIATLGLIYLSPIMENKLGLVTERFGVRGIVATTISAQVAVLPWLFYQIGEVSLVSLPTNLLIVPLVPVTMFLGFITGAFGFVSYVVSKTVAIIAYFFLAAELLVVKIFSALPMASVTVPQISLLLVLVVYALLVFYIWKNTKPMISTTLSENELKEPH